MLSINTLVEINDHQLLIPTEKKRIIKCGFLNYEATIKKGGQFIESTSCKEFHPNHSFTWESKSTVPDVFQLNKPHQHQSLMHSMTHIQPNDKPFGLNFEIPRLGEFNPLSSILSPRADPSFISTSYVQPQNEPQTTQIQESNFYQLTQSMNGIKPKYWEDLNPENSQNQVVELQPIHISQKSEIIQSLQQQNLKIISSDQYIQLIYQMLLGFQNEYFIFDTEEMQYQQQQTIYVEDYTCLQQVTHKFIDLANYVQKLRFYLLKPSNTILRSKINSIIQSFLDEFQQNVLETMIMKEDITIIQLTIYTTYLLSQIKVIYDIFTIDDCMAVNKVLYERVTEINQRNDFLIDAFYDLNNFQLQIFAKGINTQDIELQIPSHFPFYFTSTYGNTVQGLALMTQLKQIRLSYVEEILQICQITDLSLIANVKEKYQKLEQIYQSKLSSLKDLIKKYKQHIKEQELQEQQKRKEEFLRIQKKVQLQKQKQLEQQKAKQAIYKHQQDQLLLQIEVNRINRKYKKLIDEQEERNLQLEQELNEKKQLQKEKEKLISELAGLGIVVEEKQNEQVDMNPTPIDLMTKKEVDHLIEESPIAIQGRSENQIIEEIQKETIQEEILEEEKKQSQIFEEEIQEENNYSFQLQFEICVGVHARKHNQLVNQSLHFLLFDQLKFLSIWDNIRKFYFTSDGDYVENNIFQLIDNQIMFVPNSLMDLEIFPKLKSKSKLSKERQGFYECNISDQMQIKIDSKAQLLKTCFTNSILQQILIFFDQIIKLRYQSFNLRRKWKHIHCFKDAKTANIYGMLRYQMQTFIDIYQNYIFYDVLESTWNEFKQSLIKSKSIDEIIMIEGNYLNKILETTLLKSDKKIIRECYTQCEQMINQFLQILDFQYNFGLIQKQPPDISKLCSNFKKQSEFFSKFITWLKDPTTFDKPV